MNNSSSDRLPGIPVIGILRNIPFDLLDRILPLYAAAGLVNLEITMNTKDAARMIRHAVDTFGDRLHIGAGTVCTPHDLELALGSGAAFIVTPIIDEAVIRTCRDRGVPVYPGAYSPTEIYKAWSLGATMVKVFPAAVLGPAYIRDVKASLNTIRLLPTGGIGLQHIDSFLEAGADGFGIGSPLFDRRYIEAQDWTGLQEHFKAFAGKLLPLSRAGKKQGDA